MKLRTLTAAAVVSTLALAACAPLIIGGIAAGTAVVATDRRSTGAQLDDKTIQVRVANDLSSALKAAGNQVHINVNSFERRVLLTGEVPSEAVKQQAGEIASRSKNVRVVNNELVVAAPSTFGERTDDNTLGARVRASFVNTREIAFNSVDIVTERRVIYLLGAVTQKEADVAAHVASRVPGVQQVVKLFDVESGAEVNQRRIGAASPPPPQPPAASPAPITTAPVTTTPGTAR
ncbi:MAG: BON domain-containing protein [Burkholderiaceae bacterium]